MEGVRTGQLVIADVSGYTDFVNGSELEHARDILSDLLDTIASNLQGLLSVEKVEGDAIFAVTPASALPGPDLITALDACYFAFERRLDTVRYLSSCACTACQKVPDLDLKFVVHHGEFATHTVAGRRELVGADVILVHRLLKNAVALRGYALLTEACVVQAGITPGGLGAVRHVEAFEGVGDVDAWIVDMANRWDRERDQRAIRVDDGAFVHETGTLPVPPPEAWRWLTSPELRLRYQPSTDRIDQDNPGSVQGVGTRNHCVHGKTTIDEEIVDWKPYDYFTLDAKTPLGPVRISFELAPLDDGRRTTVTFKAKPMGGKKQKLMLAVGARRMFAKQVRQTMASLESMLAEPAPV